MTTDYIGIDEIELPVASGKPSCFEGFFSGNKLARLEVEVQTAGEEGDSRFHELVARRSVTVKDPFLRREYSAVIRISSTKFTVGESAKTYTIETSEIDRLPPFSSISLNDKEFSLLEYEEFISDGEIARQVLLKVPSEKWEEFRKILTSESPIDFKRIGLDEVPLKLRLGGIRFWSRHGENGGEFFKQLISLLPSDVEPSKVHLASGVAQDAIIAMLIPLVTKFELLVDKLLTANVIDAQTKEVLFSSQCPEVTPPERIAKLLDGLEEVNDASLKFLRMGGSFDSVHFAEQAGQDQTEKMEPIPGN